MRRTELADSWIPIARALPPLRILVALSLLVGATARAAEPAASRKIDFNYEIRPILSDKCFNCHGPDIRKRKAGLRLDTKDGAFARLKSEGHAIVPGNLEESELVARITSEDETDRMPEVAGANAHAAGDRPAQAMGRAGSRVEEPLGVHHARRLAAAGRAAFSMA